jgi:Tol biopolymer transport system component
MLVPLFLALQVAAGAERVMPGTAAEADTYGPTLSADGRTMYFTLRADRRGRENIVVSRLEGGRWGPPAVVSFSGTGEDKEPYLAPDGLRLFFASRRAYEGKAAARGEAAYDLFAVDWVGGTWGEPWPVPVVNSPGYDNYPAVASNGTLYFSSHRASGRNELFRSRFTGGEWQAPEAVAALNAGQAADPFIAPDERYLVFSSTRPGGLGQGDLYVSQQSGGRWTTPQSLGPLVNTADYEFTPWVTADGRWFYFSRGWGEIWRIEVAKLPALSAAASRPAGR